MIETIVVLGCGVKSLLVIGRIRRAPLQALFVQESMVLRHKISCSARFAVSCFIAEDNKNNFKIHINLVMNAITLSLIIDSSFIILTRHQFARTSIVMLPFL